MTFRGINLPFNKTFTIVEENKMDTTESEFIAKMVEQLTQNVAAEKETRLERIVCAMLSGGERERSTLAKIVAYAAELEELMNNTENFAKQASNCAKQAHDIEPYFTDTHMAMSRDLFLSILEKSLSVRFHAQFVDMLIDDAKDAFTAYFK